MQIEAKGFDQSLKDEAADLLSHLLEVEASATRYQNDFHLDDTYLVHTHFVGESL